MNGMLWFYIILIFLTIAGFFIWLIGELKYKHKVIIRECAKDKKYIIIDRAKQFTDENKVTYWKLKRERDKLKKLMPMPPANAMEITKRGKMFVEVYRTEQGEYIFIEDDGKLKDVPDDLNEEQLKEWREDNNVITPFKPFTKGQRISLVEGITKATERRTNDWKKDLPLYFTMGGMILIFICALIFMPDIITTYTKGATQISDSMQQYEKVRHQNLEQEIKQWEKVTEGIQTIYNIETKNADRLKELEKRNPE